MSFVVEDNIPIPAQGKNSKGSLTNVLMNLNVGQSVFVAGKKVGEVSAQRAVASRKSGGHVFTARTIENGVRIWRIE